MSAGRWIAAVLMCAGCGASNPAGGPDATAPEEEPSLVLIRMVDFDAYVDHIREAFAEVAVMVDEFISIGDAVRGGMVSDYWTRQYTQNLLRRLALMQEQARRIRPDHPELLHLHTSEYEAALEGFREAFEAYSRQIELQDPTDLPGINDNIAKGNIHLIRFQIFLSDLAGRQISLVRQEI